MAAGRSVPTVIYVFIYLLFVNVFFSDVLWGEGLKVIRCSYESPLGCTNYYNCSLFCYSSSQWSFSGHGSFCAEVYSEGIPEVVLLLPRCN